MTATSSSIGSRSGLDRLRLAAAKVSYTTRNVDLDRAHTLLTAATPRAGDLVLARVVEIGQHPRLELGNGRRAVLFLDDEVVVAYGNRYAPDQYQAGVPADLGPCELVAAGGVAGQVEAVHSSIKPATALEPVGLIGDASGRPLNVRHGAHLTAAPAPRSANRPVTIAVVGAAMNSGKTTTAAHLVRGLRDAGLRVGAAKTTGTGAGGDVWLLLDAGAFPVYDFTSAGLPSTYRVGTPEVRRVFAALTDQLAADGCEVAVVEVADGVFQAETAALIDEPVFRQRVDAVLFAACDALGATAGLAWLRGHGIEPEALSGLLSSSPLASREAQAATGRQIWDLEKLRDPAAAQALVDRLRKRRAARTPATGLRRSA